MNASNGRTVEAKGREVSFFFVPAAMIAAFGLMFMGVVATLNHQPLASSIETVLSGTRAPEQSEPASVVAIAQASRR